MILLQNSTQKNRTTMTCNMDIKLVVKHLANGSFGENLCRVCLSPLTDSCVNIFSTIYKEGKEYCIADILKELCDIKVSIFSSLCRNAVNTYNG